MMRCGIVLFALGALLLLTGLFLGLMAGAVVMPSYLATWLFWSSLPIGALPMVMLLDLAGDGVGFGLDLVLRRLLWLMPLAALLIIPILLHHGSLFGWASGHGFSTPFGKGWMTQGGLIARSVIYFALWSVLALLFVRRPTTIGLHRRRAAAAIGLFLYLLTATLAAVDWVVAVEPAWVSPSFGVLLIASQMAIAISVAILLGGDGWRRVAADQAAAMLLTAAGAWAFLQFTQFLVIWSGNKPADISWYLHRADTGSGIAVWIGFAFGVLLPLLLLLPARTRRGSKVLAGAALAMLIVQALDMLWLTTPSLRHGFSISALDVLELTGIGGVTLGLLLWCEARAARSAVGRQP